MCHNQRLWRQREKCVESCHAIGFSGWKIGYTYQVGTLMRSFEIYVIRGTTALTFTYSSKEDQFAALSPVFNNMVKSFQLTG